MLVSDIYLLLACIFGFMMAWGIGANDVSNAMGTSVGSRAITIRQAIIIAAIFEFSGAFLAGGEVTHTIRQAIVDPAQLSGDTDLYVMGMLSSLLSSAIWLYAASFFGWPVSTTHTIVGAIVGFGAINIGIHAINWTKVTSIVLSWILSPILGAVLAFVLFLSLQKLIFRQQDPIANARKYVPVYIAMVGAIIIALSIKNIKYLGIQINSIEKIVITIILTVGTYFIGKFYVDRLKLDPKADKNFTYTNVEKIFSVLMLFTACAMAFAHGSNDVSNAIGPVAAIASFAIEHNPLNQSQTPLPLWILLLGATGIVIGLATYGHKVIATVGTKITELTPSRGFSATLATAFTVVLGSAGGIPLSTTQTLVGGVLGVGLARGIHALNLNVIRSIFLSWVITLPAGATLSVMICYILQRTLTF